LTDGFARLGAAMPAFRRQDFPVSVDASAWLAALPPDVRKAFGFPSAFDRISQRGKAQPCPR